jgi:tagatose-1,6-bisphosphate aldolase
MKFYVHRIHDLRILVPVPAYTEDQQTENLRRYGKETGVSNLPYIRGGAAVFVDSSTEIIDFVNAAITKQLEAGK